MNKILMSFILLTFSALIYISCGGGQQGNTGSSDGMSIGVSDDEVVIGSFGPLTGPAALWGNIMKGMDAQFKMINAEGGINGRKIRFIMKDDAYDPSRTVPAVRELIQRDEIFAMVGGIGTAPCMSVVDYIVEEKVPWIPPITGATNWTIPLKKNVFSVLPYYLDEARIQATYALDSLGAKSVGIIYQNDDLGKSALVGARSYLSEKGLDFVSEVPVEATDSDLSSHIARLKDSGAEVVLLWTTPRQAVITVTNAGVINYEPQFIASFILADMTLMHELTKGAWEGVIFGTFAEPPYDLSDPVVARYKQAWDTYYPDLRWGIFPYGGFLYSEPFIEALKRLGDDITREGLIEELEKLGEFQIHKTTISYSPDNHQAIRSMQLLKCLGPEEYETLSGQIRSDVDIEELVRQMEGL